MTTVTNRNERIAKLNKEATLPTQEQAGTQVAGECTMTITLLDRVREEKQRITRTYNSRLKELNRIESLLINTDAEAVLREAEQVLYS